MVVVAQLVRASDCGSEGRRFEPGLPPFLKTLKIRLLSCDKSLFLWNRVRVNIVKFDICWFFKIKLTTLQVN